MSERSSPVMVILNAPGGGIEPDICRANDSINQSLVTDKQATLRPPSFVVWPTNHLARLKAPKGCE